MIDVAIIVMIWRTVIKVVVVVFIAVHSEAPDFDVEVFDAV